MTGRELRIFGDSLHLPLDRIMVFPTFEASEFEVEDFGIPAALVLDSVSSLVDRNFEATVDVCKRLKTYAASTACRRSSSATCRRKGLSPVQ